MMADGAWIGRRSLHLLPATLIAVHFEYLL